MLKINRPPPWLSFIFLALVTLAHADEADTRQSLLTLAGDDADARKAAIKKLSKSGDMRLLPFFTDFGDGNVYLWKSKSLLVICTDLKKGAPFLDALSRETLSDAPKATPEIAKELTALSPSRRERNLIKDATSLMGLYSSKRDERLAAVIKVGTYGLESSLPILKELKKSEPEKQVAFSMNESIALLQLQNADGKAWTPEQLDAAKSLVSLSSSRGLSRLTELRDKNAAGINDTTAAKLLADGINSIESRQSVARGIGHVFSGLSLGSILILMALGLSIIFGLMGVINMAHGELMMIGAYATYLTQKAFEIYLPASAFNFFFITAIPLSFCAAAIAGFLIERLVIRHLYGRPLETLLATWGISLILIQAVRLIFGNNIAVNSPSWLQGNLEIMQDVNLPYNRCFIIVFCILCILAMYFIIEKTKLGLLLRATTQNRNMAAALGVRTRRIDGYTFALGAGIAGLAGCALTQIGGVTPDMGQNYIVDSFMTVVTGGVGKLAGAIWAGAGLGMLNKFFEPFFGAVWGKVEILICVVLFIQWRPSGMFPAKGRTADV